MEDLSALAKTSVAPTSQRAGETSANTAHTAPGGESGVPAQPAPVIAMQQKIPPGTDGKPQAKGEDWSPPGPPAWKSTARS